MLTEGFVASISTLDKPKPNNPHKDATIFIHEFQPQPTVRSSFKKSSTRPNALATSSTHIFAAQTDKAVVNAYSVERGNQEALFPFREKITSLALIGSPEDVGILALGNAAGRVLLCELRTGRQVSTPAAHLQAIECMVVDTTNNFLLTGSPDTNVHVWSIPTLLSFSTSSSTYDPSQPSPFSPVHTLSNHRDAITALVTGHSHSRANIAVSASKDKTCVVWDYQAGKMLHTFLLATTPLCATLDPADRALYVGFDDGSVQLIDFFKGQSSENPLYDAQKTHTPTQPSASDRWQAALEASPILSMDLSYDGSSLLTGHENGKVLQWDTGTGQSHGDVIADLIAPVTNLLMQRPQGFSHVTLPSSKSINIVKPSLDSSVVGEGSADVPRDYTYKAQFSQSISLPRFSKRTTYQAEQHDELMDDFEEAMCHSSFPTDLIEEGLKALSAPPESDGQSTDLLKGWQTDPRRDVLVAQDALTEARKAPDYLMGVIDDLSKEVERLQDGERARRRNKKLRKVRREKHEEAQRRKVMGEPVESDADMEDGDGDDSTSTDDMSAGE